MNLHPWRRIEQLPTGREPLRVMALSVALCHRSAQCIGMLRLGDRRPLFATRPWTAYMTRYDRTTEATRLDWDK